MTDASQSAQTSGLVVGLDIGTTAVKAVVADEGGNIVERHRLPSKLIVGPTGRFEHDAVATWWEGPRALLRETLEQLRATGRGEPRAVAVSAMMPSVAAVDASGRPLGPGLLYGDSRGQGPAQVSDGGAGEAGARGGGGSDPTASDEMARLAGWAAADVPGAAGYWPAQAVANAALGGEGVTDLASAFASGTLFGEGGWQASVCEERGFSPA
jgi:xylulokinase